MKLKFTTKLYLFTNILLTVLRTVQIIFFTDDNGFLKKGYTVFNILAPVICGLFLLYTCGNALISNRKPKTVANKGWVGFGLSAASGILYIMAGADSFVSGVAGGKAVFLLSLTAGFACFLFAASARFDYKFPKPTALLLIAYWLLQLVMTYIFYTERPLRVRTIYEVFAVILCLLFFSSFGKIESGIANAKTFKTFYCLGLAASTFCFVSAVPEFLTYIFTAGTHVSVTAIPVPALLAGGIFTTYYTINTFATKKRKRTISIAEEE